MPNHNRKKIILYNTSISAILRGNEQYIQKLRSVLDTFKKRGDVVLWWRPHPLNEVTYKSMRPSLLSEYEQIIENYKREGFGIYDDTPALHRAIECSDAYYGDSSSLVAMYQATGKPVMIQNVGCTNYEDDTVKFEHLTEAEGYLWFTALNYNALFRMNPETLVAEYMGSIPGEKGTGERLYRSMAYLDGKLYLAPLTAKHIAIFDISGKSFTTITVPEMPTAEKRNDYMNLKFHEVFVSGEKVYFIPYWYPAIVSLDTCTFEINLLTEWNHKLLNTNVFDKGMGYFVNALIREEYVILPRFDIPIIILFKPESGEFETIDTIDIKFGYRSVCFNENSVLLAGYMGEIVLTTPKFDVFTTIDSAASSVQITDNCFIDACCFNDETILFPFAGNHVLRFDSTNLNIVADDAFPKIEMPTKFSRMEDGQYLFAKVIGSRIYALTGGTNSRLVEYDPANVELREGKVKLAEDDIMKIKLIKRSDLYSPIHNDIFPNDGNFLEPVLNLSDLIDYVVEESDTDEYQALVAKRAKLRRDAIANGDGTAGQKIYEMAKKAVLNS
jgi:hypothetical protein